MISVPTGKDRSVLLERMQQAAEAVKAMSSGERAIMHAQQAQSFVRSCVDNPPGHEHDPLPYLVAANERLHAEVQRLTDEHALLVTALAAAHESRDQLQDEHVRVLHAWQSEILTLRADLATSEQTIAALKAQLQRVKEAAG